MSNHEGHEGHEGHENDKPLQQQTIAPFSPLCSRHGCKCDGRHRFLQKLRA